MAAVLADGVERLPPRPGGAARCSVVTTDPEGKPEHRRSLPGRSPSLPLPLPNGCGSSCLAVLVVVGIQGFDGAVVEVCAAVKLGDGGDVVDGDACQRQRPCRGCAVAGDVVTGRGQLCGGGGGQRRQPVGACPGAAP